MNETRNQWMCIVVVSGLPTVNLAQTGIRIVNHTISNKKAAKQSTPCQSVDLYRMFCQIHDHLFMSCNSQYISRVWQSEYLDELPEQATLHKKICTLQNVCAIDSFTDRMKEAVQFILVRCFYVCANAFYVYTRAYTT